MMSYLWILLLGSLLAAHTTAQDDLAEEATVAPDSLSEGGDDGDPEEAPSVSESGPEAEEPVDAAPKDTEPTPADGDADTPTGDEDADTPTGDEDADTPTGDEDADAPTGDEDADAPTAGEDADPTPPADGDTGPAAADADAEPTPAVEDAEPTPAVEDAEPTPAVEDAEPTPAVEDAEPTPADAEPTPAVEDAEPADADAEPTPAADTEMEAPTPSQGTAADPEELPTENNEPSPTPEIVPDDTPTSEPEAPTAPAGDEEKPIVPVDNTDLNAANPATEAEDTTPENSGPNNEDTAVGNLPHSGRSFGSDAVAAGASGADQPQAQEGGSGSLAGILSAIVVSAVGAVAGYFTYQKKKLCFKGRQEADPEAAHKADPAEAQSDPQVLSNLLNSS